jgi:uncharacterized protein (DUF924 family)
MSWIEDVLHFWFRELHPDDWWNKRLSVDASIARRFTALHDALSREASAWHYVRAEEFLAAVLVLDQLSRHLFRGDPRAFASDGVALAIARRAVEDGYAGQLEPVRRRFLYMPYEHSEERTVQAQSLLLFGSLPGEFADDLLYAVAHQRIIDRFGRFPHRNRVLGRVSTAEEIAFLEEPMSSF